MCDIFFDYYTNIVSYSSGKNILNIADSLPPGTSHDQIIDNIIQNYTDHPSITCIKNKFSPVRVFKFENVNEASIIKLLKTVNIKKALGIDGLPPYILNCSAEILAKPITQIINQMLIENTFPSEAKLASILPLFKKNDRSQKNNYRPISILSALSKIFERVLHNQIVTFADNIFSIYVSAYRKCHSTQHVLIRLIEEWKEGLDNGYLVGSVLMDLSKAFDCISHDLIIAKLNAYGFDRSALKLIYSYLKGRRQCVKINGVNSKFLTILAGVPQGSILGPILFNLFINDFYYIFESASLYGFADDHSISAKSKSLEELKQILTSESNVAIKWLNENEMLANPSKFQSIILTKSNEHINSEVQINNQIINTNNSVVLLGVEIDDKLTFQSHISKLCRKSAGQLNALYRFKKYFTTFSKKLVVNSFIFSNFNYCSLAWNFCSSASKKIFEKIQNSH